MRVISWSIALVIGVVVVLFAVSNRDSVMLTLWPLEGSIALPLFVPILVVGFIGFIAGGIVTWLSAAPWRRLARRRKRRIHDLEQRVEALEAREARPAEPAAPGRPAAPPALRPVPGGRA